MALQHFPHKIIGAFMFRFIRSLFPRAAAGARVPTQPASYQDKIEDAHKALADVTRSKAVLPAVATALAKPIAELSRLEAPEIRKLAHHAYHGIGECVCEGKGARWPVWELLGGI